jgi:hypothetical protein
LGSESELQAVKLDAAASNPRPASQMVRNEAGRCDKRMPYPFH